MCPFLMRLPLPVAAAAIRIRPLPTRRGARRHIGAFVSALKRPKGRIEGAHCRDWMKVAVWREGVIGSKRMPAFPL